MISHLNVLGAFLVFFVPACQQRQATYDPQSRKRISICGHFISCSRNGSYTLTSIFSSLLRTFFYLISLIPRREGTRSTPRIHKEQGELNFAFMRFMPSLCSLCLPAGKGRLLTMHKHVNALICQESGVCTMNSPRILGKNLVFSAELNLVIHVHTG